MSEWIIDADLVVMVKRQSFGSSASSTSNDGVLKIVLVARSLLQPAQNRAESRAS